MHMQYKSKKIILDNAWLHLAVLYRIGKPAGAILRTTVDRQRVGLGRPQRAHHARRQPVMMSIENMCMHVTVSGKWKSKVW